MNKYTLRRNKNQPAVTADVLADNLQIPITCTSTHAKIVVIGRQEEGINNILNPPKYNLSVKHYYTILALTHLLVQSVARIEENFSPFPSHFLFPSTIPHTSTDINYKYLQDYITLHRNFLTWPK